MPRANFDTWFKIAAVLVLLKISYQLGELEDTAQAAKANAGSAIEQARLASTTAQQAVDACAR